MGERTLLDGPWDAVESTSYNGEFLVIDPHGHVVAMCRHWPKHNEAHARLIAKARHLPALIDALEAAIPFLREHTICTAMRVDGNAAECQAHDVAVRALALVQDEDHG